MARRFLVPLLIVFASVSFAIAVAELALRLAGIAPLGELFGGRDIFVRASERPEIGYELVPGARGSAWGTEVAVNAAGFRGPEPSPGTAVRRVTGRRITVRRVAVLGDSIAFGNQVPAGSEFPAQLGELLREGDPSSESMNFALGGYDILQEIAQLEHRALAYEPSHVVLAYCLNDAGVVSTNLEYIERVARYRESRVIRHSRIAQLIALRLDHAAHRRFDANANRPERFRAEFADRIDPIGEGESALRELMARAGDRHPSDWYRDEARVGRVRFGMRRLAELAQPRGLVTVVVIFPWLEAPGDAYPHAAAHAIVRAEAERHGHRVIDLYDAFSAHELKALRADSHDAVHPNAFAHRLAAEQIANEILAERREPAPR